MVRFVTEKIKEMEKAKKYIGHGVWVDEEAMKQECAKDLEFVRKYIMDELKKGCINPVKKPSS